MLRTIALLVILMTPSISFGGVIFGSEFAVNHSSKFCNLAYPKNKQTECLFEQTLYISNIMSSVTDKDSWMVYLACLRSYADNPEESSEYLFEFQYGINWKIFYACMEGVANEE